MCSLFANPLQYCLKYFPHHHQKILKDILKAYVSHSQLYHIQLVTTENSESSYLVYTVDTAHEGAAIAPFSVQLFFCSFFSYARGVLETNLFTVVVMIWFGFPVNFNAQGAFLITFLICNNLLNYLRSISTIVITTMAKTASMSFWLWNTSLKTVILCCFDVFPTRPPQKIQLQAKISTLRPVLPGYLPVSYH